MMNSESLEAAKVGLLKDVSGRSAIGGRRHLRHDIERIVAIATQLFAAIERQAHQIEDQLVIACGEQARPRA